MVAALDVDAEPGALRAGLLESAATAAADDVSDAAGLVDGHVEDRPGALVTVNVAGEHDVDAMFLVERDEMARVAVAGTEIDVFFSLPCVTEIVLVGAEARMVVGGEFPCGGGGGERLVQQRELFAVRAAGFVGIDHEEFGVAAAERVEVLGLREVKIIVVPVRVFLVVADDRENRHVGHEPGARLEKIEHPLGFGEAVVDDITAVEQEIRPQRENAVGAAACDFRVSLGVAQDAEGPGIVRPRQRLESGDLRARQVAGGIAGRDAIEIAGVGFQAAERDRLDVARLLRGGGKFERVGGAVVDRQTGSAVHFGHDRDAVRGGALEIRLDHELERLVDRLLPGDEAGIHLRDAGDFRGGHDAVVELHLLQRALERVKLVVVGIRADGEPSGRGIKDVAGLGGRLAFGIAIDVKPHRRAVVGGGDVAPAASLDRGAGAQRGELAVAVVGACGGEAESECLLVVPEHPSFFEIAVVLDEPGEAAIGARIIEQDPGRDGELARRQQRGGGLAVGGDEQPVVPAVQPEPLRGADRFKYRRAFDLGGGRVRQVEPAPVFDRVGAGGEMEEQPVFDLVRVGGQPGNRRGSHEQAGGKAEEADGSG